MSAERWRLIDSGWNTGAFNMAFDEQLARGVACGASAPTLRFFQWRPFCISLGRNQKWSDIDHDRCRREGVDVVHRPTGGRAILHAEELTYSVVFRDEPERSIEETHYRIGCALAEGLRSVGVPAELNREQADLRSWYRHPSSASCFASTARHEIQVEGRKIVGSAQRRYPGAVLQHGSILLGPAHLKLPEFLRLPENERSRLVALMAAKTTEVCRYIDVDVVSLKESVAASFADAFGIEFGIRAVKEGHPVE